MRNTQFSSNGNYYDPAVFAAFLPEAPEGEGDLTVTVNTTATSKNDDGDETGLEVVQEDEGTGSLKVTASDIDDGVSAEGVNVD